LPVFLPGRIFLGISFQRKLKAKIFLLGGRREVKKV